MKNNGKVLILILLLIDQYAIAQTSTLVSYDSTGKLIYKPDTKGNIVPDFSGVGYRNSEVAIPTVAVVKTLYPVPGDNLANIQVAINQVAAMPLGADGFRGAILFKAGIYNVSDTIQINTSGIVLRGEGTDTTTGTRFVATTLTQYTLFNFAGTAGISSNGSKRAITDAYIPYGSNKLTVTNASNYYKVGDSILVTRSPDSAWINLLTMAQWGWTASSYSISFERKVAAINGNIITLDAPMVDIIDTVYAKGTVNKYKSARIQQCGIENMSLTSVYTSDTAENHGWEGVDFDNAMNCWASNVAVYFFGYSAVHIYPGASWITVQNCQMLDAKSQITGERRYSFDIEGQRSLIQNCVTRNGRHDFVTGARNAGPNVFYNGSSTIQQNDIGPHQRWATGTLYDNIVSNGSQDVQNRESYGTGHGWAGGQIMFWNCKAGKMIIQDPEGDETNWNIGCTSPTITNVGDLVTEPFGVVQSQNKPIAAIPSLFLAQLNNRLGTANKIDQIITYDTLPVKILGAPDFIPSCSASSGLAVSFTSMNTSVATIVNGKIHIVGVGTAIINASQSGDSLYKAAPVYGQLLTVQSSLPVQLQDIKATIKTGGVEIDWQAVNEVSIKEYMIEKSSNGEGFTGIGSVKASNQWGYSFLDIHPILPAYYRIKTVGIGGEINYSSALLVTKNNTDRIIIYPNPASNYINVAGLQGLSSLKLINEIGQVVLEQMTATNALNLDLSNLKAGVYIFEILNGTDCPVNRKIIKQ